jgi:hypothetical protein
MFGKIAIQKQKVPRMLRRGMQYLLLGKDLEYK